MSTTTGTTKAPGNRKRIAALEQMEIVATAVNLTISELHVNAIVNVTSAATITFPQDSDNPKILPGMGGLIRQAGAGAATLVAGSGATLNEQIADLAGAGRYARWFKIAANTYDITGNYVS